MTMFYFFNKDIKCNQAPFRVSRKILLFLITLLSCNGFISAQQYSNSGSKQIKYYSSDEYNGHSQNWSMLQNKEGIFFFANNSGILEFDGVNWQLYKTGYSTRCLADAGNNTIVVGGDNGFGYLSPDEKGMLVYTNLASRLPEAEKSFFAILTVFSEGNKKIYFGFRSILVYEGDSLVKSIHAASDFRFAFHVDDQYLVRQSGIGLMRFTGDTVELLPGGDFFAEKSIYMCSPWDEENLMIVTRTDGIFLVSRDILKKHFRGVPQITPFRTDVDQYLIENTIYHGTILPGRKIGLGTTQGGLVIVDQNGKMQNIFNKATGLKIDNTNYIYEDRENNIWLALNNGIARIEVKSPLCFFSEDAGLSGLTVSILRTSDMLYVGTLEGLYVLVEDKSSDLKSRPAFSFQRLNTGYNSFMMLGMVNNQIVTATRNGFFSISDMSVAEIAPCEFSFVFKSYKKEPGIVFVNYTGGLKVLRKKATGWEVIGQMNNLSHEIRYIEEDEVGNLWINGPENEIQKLTFRNKDYLSPTIVSYDSSKGVKQSQGIGVLKLFGRITAYYPGVGFSHYNPSGNRFVPDPAFPAMLGNDSIFFSLVAQTNDSVCYATSNLGLVKITKKSEEKFDIEKVYPALASLSSLFFMTYDSTEQLLWMGRSDGLCYYDLKVPVLDSISFTTAIRRVTFGVDSVIFWGIKLPGYTDPELPFLRNSMTFEFSSLCYERSESNEYSYMLEGINDSWSKWSREPKVTYNYLPVGSYVFKVKSKNFNGNQSPETTFAFEILPPWYRTTLAYILYLVGLILIVYVLVKINGRRLQKINEKLERMVEERTREIENQKKEILEKNDQLEKLSIVARETDNSVMIMDEKGYFEWVNDGFVRLYGFDLETLKKEHGTNLPEYSSHPQIREIIYECVVNRKPQTYEAMITTADGKKIWTHTTLSPVINKSGKVYKIVAIDSDITKIKEYEAEIIQQKEEIETNKEQLEEINKHLEKLSIVARETENTVIIMDKNANFEWINESLSRIYGYSFEDFIKHKGQNLIEASYNQNIKNIIRSCLTEKKTVSYESETTLDSGKVIWTQTTLTPILDKDGDILKIVAIDSDITRIKKAEEKIKAQSTLLEKNLHELEKKSVLISSSIDYARKIQDAMLPSQAEFSRHFPDSFLFYKPRDIVSGDFYWIYEDEKYKYLAVVDCTGHGVPGAFMSIIGNTLLNEIVREKRISDPSTILDRLHEGVVRSLKQEEDSEHTQDDGMDISLCRIDKNKGKITISAANHTVLLVMEDGIHSLEGDYFSIGGQLMNRREVKFSSHTFALSEIKGIYLYTDGFQDQFGGKTNTKFMVTRFFELLSSISDKPMDKQRSELEKILASWSGNQTQIDDILVIGINFSDL